LGRFLAANKNVIDKLADKIHTYDFHSGKKTDRTYTKAKIIDMYGFQLGKEKDDEKKQAKK
jgi:hypothetical protein